MVRRSSLLDEWDIQASIYFGKVEGHSRVLHDFHSRIVIESSPAKTGGTRVETYM